MFAEYFSERENLVTIQKEKYFFAYRIDDSSHGKIFFCHTFFIKKEFRNSSAFREMMSDLISVYNGFKCFRMVCTVQIDDENHVTILPVLFKAGFEIYSAKEKTLWLRSTERMKKFEERLSHG